MDQSDMDCPQEICRVCLERSSKMYPLIGSILNVDINISTMITYCTSIELALDEDLPKGVCIPCFRTIRIAYNFICQFKEANQKLLEERELKIKEENDPEIDSVSEELNCSEEASLQQDLIEDEVEEEEIVIACVNEALDNEISIELIPPEVTEQNCIETNVPENVALESKLISKEMTNLAKDVHCRPSNKKILKNYVCPICSKGFRMFDSGFVKHLSTCHKDGVLKCNKCSLDLLLNMETFVQHYKKIHLYQCHICNRSFEQKSSQYYHMKVHKASRSYECSFENCKKSFLTSWNLRKHLNTHSDATKYICSKCGSKFKTYDTFRYHQKTHDGNRNHLCTECGRAFLQAVHLKYHMWKHTGIKQFCCNSCDKSYTSVTQLKKHKRKYCDAKKIEPAC